MTTPPPTTPQQRIAAFMRGAPPTPDVRGFTFYWRGLRHEPGRFELAWEATEDFCIPGQPIVHGGVVSGLLDGAMGWATLTVLEEDESFVTADLHVQFLRAGRLGPHTLTATVVRRTRQLVFCEAELRSETGDLIARGAATEAVLTAR